MMRSSVNIVIEPNAQNDAVEDDTPKEAHNNRDIKDDFSDSKAKKATRFKTLDIVKEKSTFWFMDRLTVDWLELTGKNDPTLTMLLKANALSKNARYIGLTNESSVIAHNEKIESFAKAENAGLVTWKCENLEPFLDNHNAMSNVGILVADGYMSAANGNLDSELTRLFMFADRRYRQLGQFLLVLNLVLRGNSRIDVDAGKQNLLSIIGEHVGREVRENECTIYRSDRRRSSMMLARISYGF